MREFPLDVRDFSAYYSFAPAALALRECLRLQAVKELELPEPILDVGCGDGLFARLAYPAAQTWGIDINPNEVQRAQASSAYNTLICGNICSVDLPSAFFGSAIANCSLEHVPDLEGALRTIQRSLRPGAPFALIVPTPHWTDDLATKQFLRRLGLVGLAGSYGDGIDGVFNHLHMYDEAEWTRRLETVGYTDVQVRGIVGSPATWTFDLLLYPSFVGYLTRKLTGRWVLLPRLRFLTVDLARGITNLLGELARAKDRVDTPSEYLITCRRVEG